MMLIAEFGSSPYATAWPLDEWCAAAAGAGADSVKVQIFRGAHFPPPYDALHRPHEFPRHRVADFARAAHAHGLTAGASVFDLEAVDLAVAHLDWVKLAAREADNLPLTSETWRRAMGKRTLRSISDVRLYDDRLPFVHLFAIQEYPAGMVKSLAALLRWAVFARRRAITWGWSSHTTGDADCVLAARLGAFAIEKHFALHASDIEAPHSLLPAAFDRMARRVKEITDARN